MEHDLDSPGDVGGEPEEYKYPLSEPVTYTKPRTNPRERFAAIRRIVIFLLGVAIMIDALWDRQYVVPELIIGMIMVGVLPIDEFVATLRRPRRRG